MLTTAPMGLARDPRSPLTAKSPSADYASAAVPQPVSVESLAQDLEKLAHVQAEEISGLVKLRERLNAVVFGPSPAEPTGKDAEPIPSGMRDLIELMHQQRNRRDSLLNDIARLAVS